MSRWLSHNPASLPDNVRGGFFQKNHRVWHGCVRDYDTDKIYWQCVHVHSRPEYNARYRYDIEETRADPRIWEFSAQNCGLKAARQWGARRSDPEEVTGAWGLIDDLPISDSPIPRDDVKRALVGKTEYTGKIELTEDGGRFLFVAKGTTPKHKSISDSAGMGWINLDQMKHSLGWPKMSQHELRRWLTACGLLVNSAWGLTFHEPRHVVRADQIDYESINRFIPKDHELLTSGARIRKAGKAFEVLDKTGTVVKTVPHRGKAMKELEKLLR